MQCYLFADILNWGPQDWFAAVSSVALLCGFVSWMVKMQANGKRANEILVKIEGALTGFTNDIQWLRNRSLQHHYRLSSLEGKRGFEDEPPAEGQS